MKQFFHLFCAGVLWSGLCAGCSGGSADGVSVMVTTADRTLELARETVAFGKAASADATITLDSSVRYQQMDGFGAAVTGSSAFNLLKMSATDRAGFLRETFDPVEGLGFSYIRVAIGCSDFSLDEYTCCDTPGIENFALTDEENNFVIPILREILALNPEMKIMASPWTCPRWMKVDNLTDLRPFESWTSGHLNPALYGDYAEYFVRWITAFEAAGVPIHAVTPQNEPLNRRNSASLYMGWEEQRQFVKTALGPALRAAGLAAKIYAFDHNYNYDNFEAERGYPLNIFADPAADSYLAGSAWHNYGGRRDEMSRVHDARPDRELVFTETSIGTWNDGRNLARRLVEDMEEVALGTVNNWCRGVIVWNLMLDSDRGPWREGGCKTCYGAVDIDAAYKNITRNSHYYIIGHLSAVVRPGAVRIATRGEADGLVWSAFENADGSFALVLLNKNSEPRTVSVADGKKQFTHTAPARSVASYLWK